MADWKVRPPLRGVWEAFGVQEEVGQRRADSLVRHPRVCWLGVPLAMGNGGLESPPSVKEALWGFWEGFGARREVVVSRSFGVILRALVVG